ncbi:MAG: tape measure protein [Desulforhopalus sp.]
MAKLKIDLVVDDKGKLVITGFGKEVDRVMFSSRNAVAAFGKKLAIGGAALAAFAASGGLLAGKLTGIADGYTLVDGRLKLVTDGTEQLARVQKSLYEVSLDTRQGYEQTATLYTGLARSTKELGTSEQDLLFITENLNKATIVSGASREAAGNSLRQMTQALQGGVVRAEEYNSILENTPRVLEAVASGLGITMGQLRQEMLDSELTAERFLEGFKAGAAGIQQEFEQLPATVKQAGVYMETIFGSIINDSNKASGGTSRIAESIIEVADTIDQNREGIVSLFVKVLGLSASIVENLAEFGGWLDNFGPKTEAQQQLEEYQAKIGALLERRDRLGGKLTETEEKTLKVYQAQVEQLKSIIRIQEAKSEQGAAKTPSAAPKTAGSSTSSDGVVKKAPAGKDADSKEAIRARMEATNRHILALNGIEAANQATEDSWSTLITLSREYDESVTGAADASNEFSSSANDLAEEAKNAISGWASGFSGTLNDMLWDADATFGDIGISFGKMLTQMAIQAMIIKPILDSVLNFGMFSLSSGSAAAASSTNLASGTATPAILNAATQHTGGVYGLDVLPSRTVSSAVFAGARRFHDGLRPKEYPAILEEGEGVFTKGQMSALGAKVGGARMVNNIYIINQADATLTKTEKKNEDGGVDYEVLIQNIAAKGVTRQGSPMHAAIMTATGSKEPLIRR